MDFSKTGLGLLVILPPLLLACSGPAESASDADDAEAGSTAQTAAVATAKPDPAAEAPEAAAADEAAVKAAALGVFSDYLDKPVKHTEMTPAFSAAWDHALGPEGSMGYDPFCECQDFGEVSVRIDSADIAADEARVRVTLRNFGSETKKRLVLKRIKGAWLLDDINDGDTPSLHRAMADGEPGGYSMF
jgi:hypothetical protein